jgi:Mn2+/Fe2+ NRAMP family transporter
VESLGWRGYVRAIGPGIVAGASDADPTTIATLAVVGAGTVYGLAWLSLLLFPMIAVVQTISTRAGTAAGRDLHRVLLGGRGRPLRWAVVGSILTVNVVTIAADLEGGAAAIGLLLQRDWRWFVAPLSLALLTALVLTGPRGVRRASLLLLPFVAAYAGAVVLAHPRWPDVARGSLVPHLQWSDEYLSDALSLLGTTLTSYVYVWQAIAQSEAGPATGARLRARQIDALLGGLFAVAAFWLVLVATGATLGVRRFSVDTAGDAARALVPIAGQLAGDLFAAGLLLSSVIALPVIMATTAYVTGFQMRWRSGLSLPVREAPGFYGALAGAAALGTVLAFSGVSPIRLLFVAGIVGGIATPLGLVALLRLAGDRTLMGGRPVRRPLLAAGWAITAALAALGLVYVAVRLARALG